jgi:type IV secretory pathway TrbL component
MTMRYATACVDEAGVGEEVTAMDTGLVAEAEGWVVTTTNPRAMVAAAAKAMPTRRTGDRRGGDVAPTGDA